MKAKEFITPILVTNKEKIKHWKEIPYQKLGFINEHNLLYSKNGERVRSKSEKIISDILFDNNIIYKYECPIYLEGYGKVFPDFTFYDVNNDRQIYWEHFGKMDDIEYANKTLKKIELYARNGILVGDRLIVTFESSTVQLNLELVEKIIKKIL